jgi:heme/copper-type cytochrome/quinol oxidase subunit 3
MTTNELRAPVAVPAASRTTGYSLAWWGMVTLIATESMVFLTLLSSYFFVRASSHSWPQGGIAEPELIRSSIFSVVLLSSSIPIFIAESAVRKGRMRTVADALLVSFLLGAAFLGNTIYDYTHLEFSWKENAYASLVITIVGLHAIHVLVGLCMSGAVQVKVRLGRVSTDRHDTVDVFSLYWHFVDAVWIFVFTSLFISPHIQ